MPAAIVHFEIHVTDVDRAQRFYNAVFDWKVERYQGTDYYGVWTGRSKYPNGSVVGMDGGLRPRDGETPDNGAPVNSFLCTVEVENIDTVLAATERSGGVVLAPKQALPGMGWQAVCADPDGNRFSLMQNDSQAS